MWTGNFPVKRLRKTLNHYTRVLTRHNCGPADPDECLLGPDFRKGPVADP